jgi:hypothetical protein
MYEERDKTGAVIHLHSTHSVAISCLADIDPADVLPPITAYYVMRVGRLPLVPYYRPGDMALAEAVRGFAGKHHAVLLANHGPVVAGASLDAAANAIEKLEETAKLFLLLRGCGQGSSPTSKLRKFGQRFRLSKSSLRERSDEAIHTCPRRLDCRFLTMTAAHSTVHAPRADDRTELPLPSPPLGRGCAGLAGAGPPELGEAHARYNSTPVSGMTAA